MPQFAGRLKLATILLALLIAPAGAVGESSGSGLPVPRYVSLKADKVNVRGGPSRDHDVSWVFTRAGMPVEITAESENWRRIRDADGTEGWVYHSLLSGSRRVTTTSGFFGLAIAAPPLALRFTGRGPFSPL